MKRFVRLYPRAWRERYGAEIEALIERMRKDPAAVVDLLRGVVDAHLHPELPSRGHGIVASADAGPLVLVPGIGFRHREALGTAANTVLERDGRTLIVAVTPDRDGVRVDLSIKGVDMPLGRFEGTVRITDETGRELPVRPRWQVGGQVTKMPDGMAMLRYVTLLEPPPAGTRTLRVEIDGSVGTWRLTVPVEPAQLRGTPAMPIDALDSRYGIALAARAIARSAEQTAVEVEAFFDPPAYEGDEIARRWVTGLGGSGAHRVTEDGLALEADDGTRYASRGMPQAEPATRRYRETMFFAPLPPELKSVTLRIPHVFTQESTDEALTLGVPSETDVKIAGCSARIAVSRITDSTQGPRVRIQATPSDPSAARQLAYMWSVDTGAGPMGTVGTTVAQCFGQLPYVEVPDPAGQLAEVTLRAPVIEIRGPWTLRVPLDAQSASSPR